MRIYITSAGSTVPSLSLALNPPASGPLAPLQQTMAAIWRTTLITTVSLWLIFSIARQAFDLIGRLWIPVIFNLLQILCCIMGLFAVCQNRKPLLITFGISCLISAAYNAIVFCWYLGFFGDITQPVLSAGLPFSFSFFLKYTPTCASHFDLQKSIWVQDKCTVPFYHIEAAQSVLHVLLSLLSIVTCIGVLCTVAVKKTRKKPGLPMPLSSEHLTSMDTVSKQRMPNLRAPSSINEHGSGYMNSSYDESNDTEVQTSPNYEYDTRPNFKQHSKRKRGRGGRVGTVNSTSRDIQPIEERAVDAGESVEVGETQTEQRQSGRFRKVGDQRRQSRQSQQQIDDSSQVNGNTHSLISFDPKSNTLIRVRNHIESESEDEPVRKDLQYSKIYKSRSVERPSSSLDYERIREDDKDGTYERISSYRKLGSQRGRDTVGERRGERQKSEERAVDERTRHDQSTDSVPSIMAPMAPLTSRSRDSTSDSGIRSASEQWPPPPSERTLKASRIGEPWTRPRSRSNHDSCLPEESRDEWSRPVRGPESRIEDTGVTMRSHPAPSISSEDSAISQNSRGSSMSDLKSRFQLRLSSSQTAVGHYHSAAEIGLVPPPIQARITNPRETQLGYGTRLSTALNHDTVSNGTVAYGTRLSAALGNNKGLSDPRDYGRLSTNANSEHRQNYSNTLDPGSTTVSSEGSGPGITLKRDTPSSGEMSFDSGGIDLVSSPGIPLGPLYDPQELRRSARNLLSEGNRTSRGPIINDNSLLV